MKKDSKRIQSDVRPSLFLSYRDFLDEVYRAHKTKVGGYSYQKFSADLGLSATGVAHQIIRGRRKLTRRNVARIAAALKLKGNERLFLEKMVDHNNASDPEAKGALLKELAAIRSRIAPPGFDRAQMTFFSEWWHAVIRELVALPSFVPDPEWIAGHVLPRIRPEQARKSLELLSQLGMIVFDKEKNTFRLSGDVLATPLEASALPITRFQQSMMDLGRESITTANPELRSVTSITLRVSNAMIDSLKQKLYDLQMEILAGEADPGDTSAIYQLNIQLFPLTTAVKSEETSNEDAA